MTDGYEWAEANPDLFARLTRATRAADKAHQTTGGGTRHWIRDCFIGALAEEGLEITAASFVSAGAGQVPAGTIEKALAVLYQTCPREVADVCDEILDRRGALLGRVRALAAVRTPEEQT